MDEMFTYSWSMFSTHLQQKLNYEITLGEITVAMTNCHKMS